ncbi:sushi, von Willebrand factor type A, EGF and pentraxin domain-containing protein 1-like isoform X2 [Branchiostoma lanceolatum]|uniref:sushi, von Willebrand factor type A, EGF and pentraxin domain-containing protein 1-like isoform X2 n=1 Tax=Branchiostoma lanceolatum TaxID=7740 RepID=UPI0034548185
MATHVAFRLATLALLAVFLRVSAQNTAQMASSLQNQVKKYQDSRADIVFLLDNSGSVGRYNFEEVEIAFVENLLSQLTISPQASRVAIVSFDDVARTHIDYIKYPKNKCSFLRELKTVKYIGQWTNTEDAFRLAQELLRPPSSFKNERPVKQVVVLLTDGKPTRGGDPVARANNLKSVYDAEIFSIGIGGNLNKQQLSDCATDASHVFLSPNFVDFKDLAKRIRGDPYLKRYVTDGVTSGDCSSPSCGSNSKCTCGSETGEYECACKPGYYGTGRGAPCTPCPKGRYKDLLAPSVSGCPGTCPAKSSTRGTAATSPNQCVCNEGHEGDPWRKPGCKPVRCDPKLEAPEGGTVQPANCNNEYLTTCQFQCNYGYKMLRGTPERTCHANKTWSGAPTICQKIECPGLALPSDGQRACVTSDGQQATGTFPYETTCTFTCNQGYTLQGSSVRKCLQEGKWDGTEAKCLVKKCDPLPMVVNATVSPSTCVSAAQKFDTACQFTCQDGYRMDGTPNRVCLEDGSWSNQQPSCIDEQPPRLVIGCPPDIVNGTEEGQNYLTVDWTVPTAVDNSGKPPKMTVTPAGIKPPHKFPITTGLPTVVKYAFTDDSGMENTCSFDVKVIDTEDPKLTEHCSNIKVETKDESVNVNWTEPVFTDNSKQPVRVNCDKDSGQRFYWGTTWVTCTARDIDDNFAECRFYVTVSPTRCPHQDPPINGALSCDRWLYGQFCSVQCEERFDFYTEPARLYVCGSSGQWRTDPPGKETKWPDCSLKRIPGYSKGIEFQYYVGDCEDEETQKQIKQNFIDLFNSTVFGKFGGCVGNVNCSVDNVAVFCGEQDEDIVVDWVPEDGGLDGPARKRRSVKRRGRLITIRLFIKTQYKNTDPVRGESTEVTKKMKQLKDDMNEIVKRAKEDVRTGQLSDMSVTAGGRRRGQMLALARVSGSAGEDVGIIDLDTDAVLSCDRGKILEENLCVDCPVGTYYTDVSGEATCDVCPVGSYQDEEGKTECIQCEPGFFTAGNNSKNATDCRSQCQPGTYSETGLETCMFCPKGTYQNQQGATECIPCEEGTTTGDVGTEDKDYCSKLCVPGSFSRTGTDPCELCPVGTFQPGHGQTDCLSCPLGTGTGAVGSEARSDCVELDYCQSSPCQNGGSCSMQGSEFNCLCPAGFEGDMCDVNVDECASMPCYSLATCLDRVNGYECVCASGWTGEQCDVNINECAPAPCLNGATCVDEDNGFLCLCADGYSGTFCEVNIDDCSDSPCYDTAVCVDLVDSFQCLCQDGYTGKYCEVNTNDCETEPCQNGGKCIDEVGRYTCQCKPGFVGYNCELNVNECASNPCLNRADCEDKINSYQCHCAPGFGGTHCEDELSADFDLKFPKGMLSEFTSGKIGEDLRAVTVSFWMKMALDKKGHKYVFSYAAEEEGVVQDNALVIEVDNFNEFLFMVNGEKITTTALVDDEAWHHYAFTWSLVLQCPAGYQLFRDVCYKVFDSEKDYLGSVAVCEEDGGTLAMPLDQSLDSFLIKLRSSLNPNVRYWIGLTDREREGTWSWTDGRPLGPFTSWAVGEPNNAGNEDCVVYGAHPSIRNKWNDVPCSLRYRFICQTPAMVLQCPAGYRAFRGACYKAFDAEKTYTESEAVCSSAGGTLAMPQDKSLNTFLIGLKNSLNPRVRYWIGLNDKAKEGAWRWSDDLPVGDFSSWAEGEPNNAGDEDCAVYAAHPSIKDKWNDVPCWLRYRFICRVPATDSGSAEEEWTFYVDGQRTAGGSEGGEGRVIPGGGTIVLGQDQDEILGGFDSKESFKGELSRLNVWDHVLTEAQISVMAEHCTDDSGNVRAWPDFRAAAEGLEVRQGSAFCAGKPSLAGVNECASNPCMNGGSCVDHINTFTCLCTPGYSGINCQTDTNKCGPNNAPCDHKCHDRGSGYKCKCGKGFKLFNEVHCIDDDECAARNGGCDHNCINTPGSHLCSCYPGYVLGADQKSCVDVNECEGIELRDGQQLQNGGCSHTCVNLEGSHECRCPTGLVLSGDDRSCQDIDECETGAAGCSQLCINTLGSFQCACHPGYTLLPDGKMCQAGTKGQGKYRSLGCWKDTGNRAIPALEGQDPRLDNQYRRRHNPIEKCYQVAKDRGYHVFAIQHGGWCASSATARDTYQKYGPSSNCEADGEGGGWANQVYEIISDRSCSKLPEFKNGIFEVSSSDSTVGRVVCNDGYRVLGNPELRCDITGHWGGSLPRCIEHDCGKSKKVKNGARLGSGHSVEYNCNEGYAMVAGDGERTCQLNGVWSGEDPVCKKADCPQLPKREGRLRVLGSQLTAGSMVRFVCPPGFEIQGPATSTCRANGQWSHGSSLPECDENQTEN